MREQGIEKTVYFIRHGQSEDNLAPIFQTDESPLSGTGKQQAATVALRASKIAFDALISSPLPRAQTTAELIAQATGKSPEYCELFIEAVKPLGLAGKRYDDSESDGLWKQWYKSQSDPTLKVGTGENYTDLIARADVALEYLRHRPEKTLMVVTHGYILQTIIIRVLLGESLTPENFKSFQSRISMKNTGLSVIQYGTNYVSTSWKLWIYNDHAHLG